VIGYDRSKIRHILLGKNDAELLPDATMDLILQKLGFEIEGASVKVPIWRSQKDINHDWDLAEEV